jgi:hypothetical protein
MPSWKRDTARGVDHPHHRAGQVFWLQAGATWLNQDKPRPFVLASEYFADLPATLVYGSTQETERRAGAACITVDPLGSGVSRNGLLARTYFYPGTLLLATHEELPPHAGYLGKSLPRLRDALRTALGIGQGSCRCPGVPQGSRRGRIVVLAAPISRLLHARFAVVLTEHGYSGQTKYQLVVPLVDGADIQAQENELRIPFRRWMAVFRDPVDSAVLPVSLTMSVWHDTHIAHETEHVVDEETLREIDRRLCDYFSLEPADEE